MNDMHDAAGSDRPDEAKLLKARTEIALLAGFGIVVIPALATLVLAGDEFGLRRIAAFASILPMLLLRDRLADNTAAGIAASAVIAGLACGIGGGLWLGAGRCRRWRAGRLGLLPHPPQQVSPEADRRTALNCAEWPAGNRCVARDNISVFSDIPRSLTQRRQPDPAGSGRVGSGMKQSPTPPVVLSRRRGGGAVATLRKTGVTR